MNYRHMLAVLGLSAAVGGILPYSAASAQEVPIPEQNDAQCDISSSSVSPGDPDGADDASESASINCARQEQNRVTLLNVQETIEDVVVGRLLGDKRCPNGGCPEPAGLRYADSAEAQRYMMQKGGITIAPAADVVAATPTRLWNAWVDGKYTWTETDDGGTSTDGPLFNLTAGIDYKISDRVIFGLIGSFEHSDFDTDGPGSNTTKTNGWGGGAYVGVTITDHIVFSGLVTGASIDTDSNLSGAKADFDSDRLQASGGFTGYWYFGQWRMSPSLTLAWSKEWQNDYTDSSGAFGPDQTFETAILSAGNQAGYSFALADGTSIEPWAGFMFDWTFVDKITTDGFDDLNEDDSVDLRLQTGLNWNLAENAQLALTGEIAGLLVDDTDSYAGEINFAVQF